MSPLACGIRFIESCNCRFWVYRRHRFASTYKRADAELLAAVDEAHDTLNGAAAKKVMEREFSEYGKAEYERISKLSVAHIYRLRWRRTYRNRRVNFTKTRPTVVTIAERRCAEPGGRPGFLRVDTVHQGDLDGIKSVYPINAVDEVTQWEVVVCVANL